MFAGELAVTMLSQNNDATTEHEQREAPNKLNCKSRSRSFHFKPSKSSTPSYSRSLSASSRFATLKIFRKKSLSKIISDWKSDDNDDDLTSSSDYVLSPPNTTGILKIYVGSLSLGSNYKSILVTVKTTSKNALRMILERYNIPPSNIDRYILCEVTGKVVQETLTENSKRMTKSKSLEGEQHLNYLQQLTSSKTKHQSIQYFKHKCTLSLLLYQWCLGIILWINCFALHNMLKNNFCTFRFKPKLPLFSVIWNYFFTSSFFFFCAAVK